MRSRVSRSFKAPVYQMSNKRFQKLQEKFANPEPALLFLNSALPLFAHFNQLLQREEPTIRILQVAMKVSTKRWPNVLCYQLKLERFPVFPNWFKWSWKFHGYSRYISWSTNKEHANEVSRSRRYFTKTMQGITWCCPLLSHVCSWIHFKKKFLWMVL